MTEQRIMLGRDIRPFGCVHTSYSKPEGQGTLTEVSPCLPCGLQAAAENAHQAGVSLLRMAEALGAVALVLQNNRTLPMPSPLLVVKP